MAKLIGFLGGPCTGKTTLAQGVYDALRGAGIETAWATEFAGEDIERHGPPDAAFSIYEQFRFSLLQRRKEEVALASSDVVVTDAPLLLGYAYPLLDRDESLSGRQQQMLPDLACLFAEDATRYDILYLLKRETTYEDNGVRYHTFEQAINFDTMLHQMLDDAGVKYKLLGGTVPQRVAQVLKDLEVEDKALRLAV